MTQMEALTAAANPPLKEFMVRQTREKKTSFSLVDMAGINTIWYRRRPAPLFVVVPLLHHERAAH